MARRTVHDPAIGKRIRDRRNLLGYSIRFTADRGGISHTTLSRIERGEMSADNRFTLAAIAGALRCSVAELTGMPFTPTDSAGATTQASVHDVRQALVEIDLADEPTVTPRPMTQLAAETDLVYHLRGKCDYAGAASRLPLLLRELHAAADTDHRAKALRLLTGAADVAAFVVRYVGFHGESWLAAERAREAAEALGEPVELALAAYTRAHAAGGCASWQRALTIAERGLTDLERAGQRAEPTYRHVMLGQLHLTAAYAQYALGRADDAHARIDAASELAGRTGDTDTLHMSFGPTNVSLWRVSMITDGGDPGDAVEIARGTNPAQLPISRRAAFHLDTARAMARLGRDSEAVRMLIASERMAPQRVRNSPLARECARGMLERTNRTAVGSELRGFAERIGVVTK